MKSGSRYLQETKQQNQLSTLALQEQSSREIKLFLDYVERDGIKPDTRYFSITSMKFIPLWTIYFYFDYDSEGAYLSSTGKLYEFRGIGYIAPASRSGKLHIGQTLAHMREAREKAQSKTVVTTKKRRALWWSPSR